MTVLIPSAKVASHWNGALEARLRHAPLEAFLRSRGRTWVLSGESRVTDNLICATVHFLDQALAASSTESHDPMDATQLSAAGEMTCAVSHGLAMLIQEPGSWRIAALVSTARLLAPNIGLDAAARLAATVARDYAKGLKSGLDTELLQVSTLAAGAVESKNEALVGTVARLIAQRVCAVRKVSTPRRAAPG